MITENQLTQLSQIYFDIAGNELLFKSYYLTDDEQQQEDCRRQNEIYYATLRGALSMLEEEDKECLKRSGKLKAMAVEAEEKAKSSYYSKESVRIIQRHINRQAEKISKLNERLTQLKSEYNITDSAE